MCKLIRGHKKRSAARLYPSFPCAWAGLWKCLGDGKGFTLMLSCQICIESLVGCRMRDLVGLAVWEWSLLDM